MLAVLVIAGTTAVGKTDLSIHLAKLLGGEIVSADSVQVRGRALTSLFCCIIYRFISIWILVRLR